MVFEKVNDHFLLYEKITHCYDFSSMFLQISPCVAELSYAKAKAPMCYFIVSLLKNGLFGMRHDKTHTHTKKEKKKKKTNHTISGELIGNYIFF